MKKRKEAHLPGPPGPTYLLAAQAHLALSSSPGRDTHNCVHGMPWPPAAACLPGGPPAPSPRATTTPGRRPVLSLSPVPAPPSLSLVQATDRNYTGAAAMELVARVI